MIFWVLAALAADPDPAWVAAERRVAEAAAAVANARHDGLRPGKIADLMAIYRQEAERLDALRPPPDPAEGEPAARASALRALSDATAQGVAQAEARAAVEAWLGPLESRLTVLVKALDAAAASPADLAASLATDIAAQADAARVAAVYDASRDDAAERAARARAASLRASLSPLERSPLSVEVELRGLDQAAAAAALLGARDRDLAARAAQLQQSAALILESP